MPQPTREAQVGQLLVLPQEPRAQLGILPPRVEVDLHFVPHASRRAQERIVRLVPHARSARAGSSATPGAKSTCTSCHPRPSGHRSGSCTTCHSVGKSWKFSHPGSGSSCASCHNRPGGHSSGACQSCHSPGSKWTFRHSSSLNCSSCHKAPSNHYGSTCQNCHSPSRSWSSATFTHPRIPGGEHSSRSFACTKCHPGSGKGPGHFCSCHGNTTGPEGRLTARESQG